jgi:hypothetical protein
MKAMDSSRLDRVVLEARRAAEQRDQSYREQALKIYPWICGRCAREFTRINLRELTVHHRDHNHDNNPPDGSNWELLCLYCHDHEHDKSTSMGGYFEGRAAAKDELKPSIFSPFEKLDSLIKPDDEKR